MEAVTRAPFFDEMRSLGWIEGRTIEYDRAYADRRGAADGTGYVALYEIVSTSKVVVLAVRHQREEDYH